MIELTRLNGSPLFVNYDHIKWAEAAPDTMLTLTSGEKLVVRESCAEVVQRMANRRAQLLRQGGQPAVGMEIGFCRDPNSSAGSANTSVDEDGED